MIGDLVSYAQSAITGQGMGVTGNLVFYSQSTSMVISGQGMGVIGYLVSYAQSTSMVISQ